MTAPTTPSSPSPDTARLREIVHKHAEMAKEAGRGHFMMTHQEWADITALLSSNDALVEEARRLREALKYSYATMKELSLLLCNDPAMQSRQYLRAGGRIFDGNIGIALNKAIDDSRELCQRFGFDPDEKVAK